MEVRANTEPIDVAAHLKVKFYVAKLDEGIITIS